MGNNESTEKRNKSVSTKSSAKEDGLESKKSISAAAAAEVKDKTKSLESGAKIIPASSSDGTISLGSVQEAILQGKKIVRGLYDYVSAIDPSSTDIPDLNFKQGEVMEIIDEDGDWWLAVSRTSGKKGYVPSTYVAVVNSIDDAEWFHGKLGRREAEKLLSDRSNDRGTFLIRESDTVQGAYSLSLLDMNEAGQPVIKHYRIRDHTSGKCYITTKYLATSIEDLVKYFSKDANGLAYKLVRPCPKVQPIMPDLSRDVRDVWEIDRTSLEFIDVLGKGNFGEVWKGRWNTKIYVAIKTMKTGSAMSKEKFLEEADLMKKLKHDKLVRLYAVCSEKEPFYIVTELMTNGSLLEYLRKDKGAKISTEIILDMAVQIADGMKYIEHKNYIHRDLAARNILVGNNNIVKIGDFGLARAIDEDIYTAETGTRLPIRWTALEAITHHSFTIKSDVWAFGILLIEMLRYGQVPYQPDLKTNADVVVFLKSGGRHSKPSNCEPDLYEIILGCWHRDPNRRPTFDSLYDQLYNLPENKGSGYA